MILAANVSYAKSEVYKDTGTGKMKSVIPDTVSEHLKQILCEY